MPSDQTPQVTVKTENGAPYKRLPSFKSPRDLKLSQFRDLSSGNVADVRPKKLFVPNLNVHRKRADEREENRSNDAESTATPGDTSNRGRGSFDRGRGRGRGGKRPKEFIQQAGVFSQGLAPSMKPSWGNKNHDSSASTGISKPKLKLNENLKINKEEEEEMMKELLRDDFIDDPNIEADFDNAPVELPLQDVCKWEMHLKEEKPGCEMEYGACYTDRFMNGIKVKPDPESIERGLVNGTNESKPVDVQNMRPLSLSQLLSTSQEKNFLFFQIPHRIPKLKMNVNSFVSAQRTPGDCQSQEEMEDASVLRSLPPGRIGTLQIRKSGRAVLVLGDVHLNVQSGTQSAFKQDLVSVNLENSTKTGNMTNMGTVTTRILVTPDWQHLLKSSK